MGSNPPPVNYGRNTQEPYDKHYYSRDVLCPRKTTVFPSKNKDYRESNSNCNKNRLKNIHKRQRTFRDGKATLRRIPRFQLEYELID